MPQLPPTSHQYQWAWQIRALNRTRTSGTRPPPSQIQTSQHSLDYNLCWLPTASWTYVLERCTCTLRMTPTPSRSSMYPRKNILWDVSKWSWHNQVISCCPAASSKHLHPHLQEGRINPVPPHNLPVQGHLCLLHRIGELLSRIHRCHARS